MEIDHEERIIAKILAKIPAGTLDADEVAEIKEGLVVLRSVKGIVMIGGFIKQVLLWFGIVIGAWLAFKGYITEFISGVK